MSIANGKNRTSGQDHTPWYHITPPWPHLFPGSPHPHRVPTSLTLTWGRRHTWETKISEKLFISFLSPPTKPEDGVLKVWPNGYPYQNLLMFGKYPPHICPNKMSGIGTRIYTFNLTSARFLYQPGATSLYEELICLPRTIISLFCRHMFPDVLPLGGHKCA